MALLDYPNERARQPALWGLFWFGNGHRDVRLVADLVDRKPSHDPMVG